MEIVNIEAQTFEAIFSEVESFAKKMDDLAQLYSDKGMSEWLDNEDVCLLLKVSSRTLQTLRNNGTLSYTRISHKIYYKPADVKQIVPLVEDRRKEMAYRGKSIYETI